MKIAELVKSADWKNEKHVPVIDVPATVKAGEKVKINVCVGKEIAHPNTTEHFIKWIKVFFKPQSSAVAYELANVSFDVHGESAQGANQGVVYTEPFATVEAKFKEGGELVALSYCNIHGLWEGSATIAVE